MVPAVAGSLSHGKDFPVCSSLLRSIREKLLAGTSVTAVSWIQVNDTTTLAQRGWRQQVRGVLQQKAMYAGISWT